MRTRSHGPSAWLVALALVSNGCDDSLKSVSLLSETRVLGARVEVEADPTRSSPKPGEHAALRFFVAAPDGEPRFSYALSVCAVRLTNSGFPPCAGAPFASALQPESGRDDARLDFQIPGELDLATTPHAFASGLICTDSGLNFDVHGAPACATGSGTEVAFEFELGGPDSNNGSPTFAPDAFLLDGEPWWEAEQGACDDGSSTRVTGKTRHTLSVDLAQSDFESLTPQTSLEPSREILLFSPFASGGKLAHGFLSLAADSPLEQRQVNWDAPGAEADRPELIRFYFVVRDARGGEDFATRALCVVP